MSRKALLKRVLWQLSLAMGRFNNLKHIEPQSIERLVFVCRGNVCRSPYAEIAARTLSLDAISCGTDVRYSASAEKMAVRAAQLRGIDLTSHISQSIFDIQFDYTDCMVAMDPSHLPIASTVAKRVGCQITLIGLWCCPSVAGVEDPFGKELQGFCDCFDRIDEALNNFAAFYKKMVP